MTQQEKLEKQYLKQQETIAEMQTREKMLVKALKWAKPRLNYESIAGETFGKTDQTPVDEALEKVKR